MSSETLVKLFKSLPLEFQEEVIHFMEFLTSKIHQTPTSPKADRPSLFGHAKGQVFMAPDFDEPLEDFKDYR